MSFQTNWRDENKMEARISDIPHESVSVCLIVPSCVLLHLRLTNGSLTALIGCRILLSIVYLTIRFKLVVSKERMLFQFERTIALFVFSFW